MKIEFIYTFDNMPQQKASYPFVPTVLISKEALLNFAFDKLNEREANNLIKISCCVYLEHTKGIKEPKWYKECKGKIWIDDLIPYRADHGMISTVSKEYIEQFFTNNYPQPTA